MRKSIIRANPDDNYKISIKELAPAYPDIALYVAGSTEEIQKETMAILDKKLELIQSNDEIENIIRHTISELARRYPNEINSHIFIRRLSRNFDL
jgi:hypothetical protein